MTNEKVVVCRWCGKTVERKDAEYWGTGALVCMNCYQEAKDSFDKMIEEVRRERSKKGLAMWIDDDDDDE